MSTTDTITFRKDLDRRQITTASMAIQPPLENSGSELPVLKGAGFQSQNAWVSTFPLYAQFCYNYPRSVQQNLCWWNTRQSSFWKSKCFSWPCSCTQTVFLSAKHKLSAGGHSEMSQAEIMLLDFEDCLLLKIFIKVRKYIGNLLLLWLLGNMQAYTSSAHTKSFYSM